MKINFANFKNIDYVAEFLIKLLVPVIFFLPLVTHSGFYFPFVTPRNFLFRLIVCLAIGLFLFLWARRPDQFRPRFVKSTLAYFALIIFLGIASLVNGDFAYSFWGNYERMEGLLNYLYLAGFLLVILGVYREKKGWLYLISVTTFASFIISFIGLSQHLGANFLLASSGGERISSTLGNATYLASYSLFHIFFAAYLYFKENRSRLKFELLGFYVIDLACIYLESVARRAGVEGVLTTTFTNVLLLIFFLAPQILVHINFYFSKNSEKLRIVSRKAFFVSIVLLNFVSLFNTQTRGALLGLIGALVLMLIFTSLNRHAAKRSRWLSISALIALVIVSGSMYLFRDTNFVQNNTTLKRMTSISLSDVTTESRLLTWEAGIKGFLDKPILGWGEERFNIVFNQYFPSPIFRDMGSQVWFDRPHNVFVQYLVTAGAVGLLAFLAIFFFMLRGLYSHYRRSRDVKTLNIFGGLIVAYLVTNFFVFDSINTYILFIVMLAAASFITGGETKKVEKQTKSKPMLGYGLLVVSIAAGIFTVIPQAMANHDFVTVYRNWRNVTTGLDREANADLLEAIERHYLGKFEMRQVYAESASDAPRNPVYSEEDKRLIVESAEAGLLRSIAEQPDNVRHHIFLVNLYLAAGDVDPSYHQKNIDLINRVIPMSPTRSQLYYSLGRAYMGQERAEEGIEAFQKGLELSPTVFESYTNLFAAYLTSKEPEKAQEVIDDMEDSIELLPEYYGRVAEIYDVFNMDTEAINYLEKGVGENPNDIGLISQAIVFSIRYDDVQRATFYLDRIYEIDPALGAQVKAQIDQQVPGFLE